MGSRPMDATAYFDAEERTASVPIWREALVVRDWASLRASRLCYGIGVPRGDGAPVVAVPGFLGTDFYLLEMFYWLRRVGYRPSLSRIGRNAGCLDTLLDRLLATVEQAQRETGRKVHLIGHSLGGLLSRAVAVRRPDLVASVITLGSPFRGIRPHPFIMKAVTAVRSRLQAGPRRAERPDCFTGRCSCEAVMALHGPPPRAIPQLAIYTRTDGIVDWRMCIEGDQGSDVEVAGTHVGLAFNARVYRIIAERLYTLESGRRGD